MSSKLWRALSWLPFLARLRDRLNAHPAWQRIWQNYLSDRARAARRPELMIRPGRDGESGQPLAITSLPEYAEFRVQAEGPLPPFIFSSFDGVFVCQEGRVSQLWPQAVYGVAWAGETLFLLTVTRKKHRAPWSRLLALEPDGDGAVRVRTLLELDTFFNLHSLDCFDNRVFLPLTNINGLLTFDLATGRYHTNLLGSRTVFKNGRNAKDYCHFNTLFVDGDSLCLMAHSGPSRPDQASEIHRFRLSDLKPRRGRVLPREVTLTAGHWCHNYFRHGGDYFWCSSLEGAGMRNETVLVRTEEGFMSRGLDWDGRVLIMGGSEIARQHEIREYASSCLGLWLWDGGEPRNLARFDFPGLSGIQDIRFLRGSRSLSDPHQVQAPAWLFQVS